MKIYGKIKTIMIRDDLFLKRDDLVKLLKDLKKIMTKKASKKCVKRIIKGLNLIKCIKILNIERKQKIERLEKENQELKKYKKIVKEFDLFLDNNCTDLRKHDLVRKACAQTKDFLKQLLNKKR